MERRVKLIVMATLLVIADRASGQAAALRPHGLSAPLRASGAVQAGQGAQGALEPWRGVRPVAPQMKGMPLKSTPAGLPHYAHPTGPGTPALPPVHTGGTRINADGQHMDNGAASGLMGAVGELQYVQLAHGHMAVYRKDDGAMQFGPVRMNAMFAAATHDPGMRACASRRIGAPTLQHDHMAKRWILSYQAGDAPYYQCIAVSATGDAAGSYYRYALDLRGPAGAAIHADDPNMAVWTDAYYFTFNVFDSVTGNYRGPRVCGIDRHALLAGAAAAIRCRDLGDTYGALVVASLEGSATPLASRSPAMILSLDFTQAGRGDHLFMWRFSFSAGILGAPVRIPVAPFTLACPGACIGQPAPGGMLAALGDRLMPRIAYRNVDGIASLVLNHSVQQANGQLGVRWYEIRDPLGAVHVYQQGTHAPDADSRWMASIGMDKAGNIAMGYGVVSSDTHPGVRYTGRHRSDPPGRMQAEEVVVNGTGVQLDSSRQVRASGALALDPVDDCTFWYTQHYVASTGRAPWRSRIASFKFENCGRF